MVAMRAFPSVALGILLAWGSVIASAQSTLAQQPGGQSSAQMPGEAKHSATLPTDEPASASQSKILLKQGTEVPLKFAQNLSSSGAQPGGPVELVLAEDLKVGDSVVVKKGARVLGRVARKRNPGELGRGGELYLQVELLKAGSTKIRLRGESGGKAARNVCWGCGIAGGVIGILAGSTGKAYVIKEGTPITAYVAEDIELPAIAE